MPLYEYQCVECHTTFEELRDYHDRRAPKCPKCHHRARRLYSAPGLDVKCDGFTRKTDTPNTPTPEDIGYA